MYSQTGLLGSVAWSEVMGRFMATRNTWHQSQLKSNFWNSWSITLVSILNPVDPWIPSTYPYCKSTAVWCSLSGLAGTVMLKNFGPILVFLCSCTLHNLLVFNFSFGAAVFES
jgi:hypothetical protein